MHDKSNAQNTDDLNLGAMVKLVQLITVFLIVVTLFGVARFEKAMTTSIVCLTLNGHEKMGI